MKNPNDRWNLDNTSIYKPFASIKLPFVYLWSNAKDAARRQEIRDYVRKNRSFPSKPPGTVLWAFRIYIKKNSFQKFDVENASKIIIDSFSKKTIPNESDATELALYEDDNLDHVNMIQIAGECTDGTDEAHVEIFYSESSGK